MSFASWIRQRLGDRSTTASVPTATTAGIKLPRDVAGIEDLLDSIGERRAVLTSRQPSGLAEFLRGGDVVAPDTSGSGEREQFLWTAATSLWVQVAIATNATNLAGVQLRATRRNRKGEYEDAADSELQRLLDEPAPGITQEDFVEEVWTYLEATGSSFIAKLRRGGQLRSTTGKLEQLIPMRPSRCEINPGQHGEWISSVTYRRQGVGQEVPFGNVVYLRYLHPSNDYWGLSRLSALRASVEADAAVAEYNAAVVRRHGVPAVILTTDQQVHRAVARRMEHEWESKYGRADRAGKAMVADRGMKPMQAEFRPRDMEWAEMARISKRRIFAAFGLPPALGMDFDEASELSNAAAQRRIYYENTLQPRGRKLTAALTAGVAREFGEEWAVRHVWEAVDAIREDEHEKRAAVRADYQAGLITLNEGRQELDYAPVPDGDRLVAPAPADAAPAQDPPDEDPEDDPKEGDDEKASVPSAVVKGAQRSPEMRRLAQASYLRRYRRWEPKFLAATGDAFADQQERVLARARGILGDGKALTKAAMSPDDLLSQVFHEREEAAEFRKRLGPVFLAGLVDAGNAKLEDLLPDDLVGAFQETHQRVREQVDRWAATRVVGITEETRRGLRQAVADALEAGADNRALQDAMRGYFEQVRRGEAGSPEVESRVERIARTEVGTALNAGGYEATRQIEDRGGKMAKSWLSARDELVRESHQQADAATRDQPIPLARPFANGLQHPNDPDGPAGEVVNCRCSLIEEVVELPTS